MTTFRCECEHKAHFHDDGRALTPNGNPGHKYGAAYAGTYIVTRATEYGHARLCKDCADDCHREG